MLLDQITRPDRSVPVDRPLKVRVLDIALAPVPPDNQKVEDCRFATGAIEVPEKFLSLRYNPDPANDTQRINRMADGEKRPFLGIPFINGKTQVATLGKFVRSYFQSQLSKEVPYAVVDDLEKRVADAALWPGKELPMVHKENDGVILPVLGRTPDGLLVLGLKVDSENETEEQSQLQAVMGDEVDVRRSVEITAKLAGEGKTSNLLDTRLHSGEGTGRVPFGKEASKPSHTEVARVYGVQSGVSPEESLRNFADIPRLRVRVGSIPDSSFLYFCADNHESKRHIAKVLEEDRQKRLAAKEKKKTKSEDGIEKKSPPPNILPALRRTTTATVILCAEESGNKTKVCTRDIYPRLPVKYFAAVNDACLAGRWEWALHSFEKTAVAGPNSTVSGASTYRLWTTLFTNLLHRRETASETMFLTLPLFLDKMPQDEIQKPHNAKKWEEICAILSAANALVRWERGEDFYKDAPFHEDTNPTTMKNTADIAEALELLNQEVAEGRVSSERGTIESTLAPLAEHMATKDYEDYALGMVFGKLFNRARWRLKACGRDYTIGRGAKFTRLRSDHLLREAHQMIDLFSGTREGKGNPNLFPQGFLPLLQRYLIRSEKNAFNAGLIAGLATYEEKVAGTESRERAENLEAGGQS